uniref:THAP-type domain-containing protein n=1 Tax=Amblyomma aureolatum TaxID=187763 RepID=A0A1E1WXJ3_9ACAR
MVLCEAWNCGNDSENCPDATFHKFPLDSPALLKAWVHNVNRPAPWQPTANSVLCSDHFLERCFVRSGKTTWLRSNALPTIFAYPDNQQQEVVEAVPDVPADSSERSESSALDHSYGTPISSTNSITVARESTGRRVRVPEEGDSLRKKLKLSRQRVRRLEERVSMLNDMVYSLLNQTIMEM